MFVQIVVNVPGVTGFFDYHVPAHLEGLIKTGCQVIVPFGKQMVQGIVTDIMGESAVLNTRPVSALVDVEPAANSTQLELAGWLSRQTLSPLSHCLNLMVPPGMNWQADSLYFLNANRIPEDTTKLPPFQKRMIDLFQKRGDLRGKQLDAAFPHADWKSSVSSMIKKGYLSSSPVLNSNIPAAKTVRTVHLSCTPQEMEGQFEKLGRGAALQRRQKMMKFLIQQPFGVEASWVYAVSGGNLQDLYQLEKKGLVRLSDTEVWRDPLQDIMPDIEKLPVLTGEQRQVWHKVRAGIQSASSGQYVKPYLLWGVTGSGKTEIYLQAVAETIEQGRQVIILAPEISLTPQTVRRFMARFPGKVGLVHSRLSQGERYDTWRRARSGLLPVIVGPRSALFSPLPDVGLIVVDEFDDESYYQMDGSPRYHAVKAAIRYAEISKGVVLLGSATPDISLTYRAHHEQWNLLSLPKRVFAHRDVVEQSRAADGLNKVDSAVDGEGNSSLPLPEIEIVDMRAELKSGNRSIFSRALQKNLAEVLQANQQAILYINRRGAATYVFCRDCGYSLRCPRCEIPLTFHRGEAAMVCHVCNYRRNVPTTCPVCGSQRIRHYGTGTERVENEIQQHFPEARILRWDAETTRGKYGHETMLSHIRDHQADIIVGTQMLAKGMDMPLVTLVGVVLADVGLNFPDYRASERVYQLLTQVSGRAGRSPLGGRAILQTFQPDHYVIRAASEQNHELFYKQELDHRRKLRYPPFYRLARLEIRGRQEQKVKEETQSMASLLQKWIDEGGHHSSDIIGPVPCYFNKVKGIYRWQVILRSPDPVAILQGRVKEEWRVEIDPPGIL